MLIDNIYRLNESEVPMKDIQHILSRIKDSVKSTAPDASVILYGSYARGDYNADSDIDILILLEKEKLNHSYEKKITYPLYDIEFDTGKIISPFVISKYEWEHKHHITPFYKNVMRDGVQL